MKTKKSVYFRGLLACVGLVVFQFSNKLVADGPWTAHAGFSSIQGQNQWYYQQRPQGATTPVTNLVWISSGAYSTAYGGTGFWETSDTTGWLYWFDTHSGQTCDTIRKWVAPSAGTVSITGRVYKINTGGGGGVKASVEKNGTAIWGPQVVAYTDGVGYTTDASLGAVSVASGDSVAFILDTNGAYGADQTGWDPTITKVASYVADAGFSSIQGPTWYFQQRPKGGGAVVNLTTWHAGGWYDTVDATGWISAIDTHPGQSTDILRKWIAPSAGTIGITGPVYKIDTGGGQGVNASVEKNGVSIWSKAVAYNDAVGYRTDSDLGTVSVSSGDSITFVTDENGTWGFEQTRWDPTISFIASPSSAWSLNTADTLLTLSIVSNAPAITRLEDAATNWNWVPSPLVLPLINKVYIGSNIYTPNWTYTSATVDTTSGTKVTLTFASTLPSLTLSQVWWARAGAGPVEQTTSIVNNSGSTITYYDADVISSDLTVTADSTVTLWRFERANVRSIGADPNFDTGVLKQLMGSTTTVSSTVNNDVNAGSYVLPFVMLDVTGTNHGLYMGYESDFGLFNTTTNGNADVVRNVFQLWNSGSFAQANGSSLILPGMFYGTYKGDTDNGSNKMKAWFWNNKITPTLRNNTNEPLIEYAAGMDTEAAANTFYTNNPIASWGAELNKEDEGWGDDQNNGVFGYDWNPNTPIATYWPNGMNLGTISHAHGVKLSLYMANTYNQLDLSTAAGVTSEEGALETRFNGTATNFTGQGYDYWRSDINCEAGGSYLSHLGFVQVLDYMISNHSGFRWENCSSGGSKKSFDLLQRQTFMTTEDSPGGPGHFDCGINFRKANYANSYMINSVQLKDDGSDWLQGTNQDLWERYFFRTAFLGAWMNGYPGTNGNYQTHTALYANHQRPILRGANVYHILPMPDGTNWDGLEFFNTTLNKGSVVLLKPYSAVGNMPSTIYLKGLLSTGTYSLKFQDRSGLNSSYTSVTGSALMSGGTGIAALSGSANQNDSEIIWINY